MIASTAFAFQSTPLIRGAKNSLSAMPVMLAFQPTPLIRGATWTRVHPAVLQRISTHAPHTRGDRSRIRLPGPHPAFQPTPLIRGATYRNHAVALPRLEFQPTPLIRRATEHQAGGLQLPAISTHAPHTRGDCARTRFPWSRTHFNPRPSYEGRPIILSFFASSALFQPTPLIRGATERGARARRDGGISTHAPHTRGDRVIA